MKKHVLLIAAMLALLGVGAVAGGERAPRAQAAGATTVIHTSGPTAGTEFDNSDFTQTVLVNVATGTSQVPPSGQIVTGPVVVNVFTPEFSALGAAAAPGLTIDGTKLSGATLPLTPVTVTVQDSTSSTLPVGTTFVVSTADAEGQQGPCCAR